jgi:hypothetical protein
MVTRPLALFSAAHVADPSYPTAIRKSYDTVAADYAEGVKTLAELDPLRWSVRPITPKPTEMTTAG